MAYVNFVQSVKYNKNKSKANLNKPTNFKAPISKTHGKRLLLRIQNDQCAQLESRCKQMEMELKKVSVTVDSTPIINDSVNIISKQQKLTNPLYDIVSATTTKVII